MNPQKPFLIGNILQRSWVSTQDTKGAIWIPALLSMVLTLIIPSIIAAILAYTISSDFEMILLISSPPVRLVTALLIAIIVAPFLTGILMVAISRARGVQFDRQLGLSFTSSWLKLAGINIIITIFSMVIDLFFSIIMQLIIAAGTQYTQASMTHAVIGHGVIILIQIIMLLCYLTFYAFMVFAMPVAIDKHKSVWAAITTACSLVQPHWRKMLGLEFIATIIIVITLLPYFLGAESITMWVKVLCGAISLIILIWSLPFIVLMHGEAYKSLAD